MKFDIIGGQVFSMLDGEQRAKIGMILGKWAIKLSQLYTPLSHTYGNQIS